MTELSGLLLSWLPAGIILFRMLDSRKSASTGLPLAYVLGLFMIHWPGAAIYLIDGYSYNNPNTVLVGFRLTTYGLWAFVIGVWLGGRNRGWGAFPSRAGPAGGSVSAFRISYTARILLAAGLVIQLSIMPILGGIATITAVVSGLSALSVVGVCLGIHGALLHRNKRQLRIWLLVALMFPLVTLTSSAFVGYGVHSLIVVGVFFLTRSRLTALRILTILLAAYLGISFYVTYMRDRDEIRQTIWYEQAGYADRLSEISKLFTDFEFFDADNTDHLISIDRRLNQNALVGAARKYVASGYKELAYGKTILFAIVALIPRAVWPDKPAVGGGGDIVTNYTGIEFAANTSVGAGQVFEFYINFGAWGVILGFIALGAAIRQFDVRAGSAMVRQDYGKFIIWFLPGLGFLQAGGNLVEVTTTVGASIGGAIVVGQMIRRRLKKKATAAGFNSVSRY